MAEAESVFSFLSDDIVLSIFFKLVDDPRNWSSLACVSSRFSSLIRTICWKIKCNQTIPAVVADLLPPNTAVTSIVAPPGGWASLHKLAVCCPGLVHSGVLLENSDLGLEDYLETNMFQTIRKRRNICRLSSSHLASGVWNLNREQGNKLLASRFRGDCLYICDWPGCVHSEEKRNYMLFRGVFKDFKNSRVWRTINDGNRSKIDLCCAFCPSNHVWDLHSAFCLRPSYWFHDDGQPVVRAYACENGHVSGAWTEWPLYT